MKRLHTRGKNGKATELLSRLEKLSLTRRVLMTFAVIAAVFGISLILANYYLVPESILHPVVAVLGVPPALLIIAFGALTATLSQTLIDVFFIPVAIGYWLLIALAVDRTYRIIYRHLGKLALALSHQKMKIVK